MAVAYTREQLQDDDIVAILRFGVEQLAIQAKALPVHCSAVAVNGNGYVFIGCSGAGKSTIANLMLTQCRLLNDEFNVIHMGNNVPTIYPTFFTDPETMEYASAEPAQCKELYFLEKGTDTSVHSMDYKSSLSALIQSAYVLPLDEFTTGKMLETIAVLHDKLSIKRLRFTNNVLTRQFLANLWGVG